LKIATKVKPVCTHSHFIHPRIRQIPHLLARVNKLLLLIRRNNRAGNKLTKHLAAWSLLTKSAFLPQCTAELKRCTSFASSRMHNAKFSASFSGIYVCMMLRKTTASKTVFARAPARVLSATLDDWETFCAFEWRRGIWFLLWQPMPLQHFIPTQIFPKITFAKKKLPKSECIALDNKCLRSKTCFLCVCVSASTQICVFAMIHNALTRARVLFGVAHDFSDGGIYLAYDPDTERHVVDDTYQITKITLTDDDGEEPLTSNAFMHVLADYLDGAEELIAVYKFCEPGRESPKYVIEKEDHFPLTLDFSITLEYSRRTSILLQAALLPREGGREGGRERERNQRSPSAFINNTVRPRTSRHRTGPTGPAGLTRARLRYY
jgi:hypothetical protein